MRNVLWHQPLILRALSSYDARREFREKERSVRIARGESRAALASLISALQTKCDRTGEAIFTRRNGKTKILKRKQSKARVNGISQLCNRT